MITFKHSGDHGDEIYSLPVIQTLARGRDSHLFLSQSHHTRVKAGQSSVDLMRPLMLAQPWIKEVSLHRGELVRYDLDRWREMPASYSRLTRTLAECHAMAFGLGMELLRQPWITLTKEHYEKAFPEMDPIMRDAMFYQVVIHRSARYQNPWFPWRAILDHYKGKILMVGLRDEHEAFCKEFSVEIPHVNTQDFLELALVIDQAKLFIGNQSSPFAIAEALKKPVMQETCLAIRGQGNPNCIFPRRWAQHVATEHWKPWRLEDMPAHDFSEQPTYCA